MAGLEMYRGDGRTIVVDLTLDGDPWPVPPGAAVRATGKRSTRDADENAIWAKSLGSGITVDGATATITLVADDTDTYTDASRPLQCDVQVTPDGGQPITVAAFELRVLNDVTRTAP